MLLGSAVCFGFVEVPGVGVCCQHHIAGAICEDGFILGGKVVKELFCLLKCFLVGAADCDAIVLMGVRRVLSTALPRKRIFHTLFE